MNAKIKLITLGIIAGICIAFGSAAYVACIYYDNRIIGSILFGVGLLLICGFGFKLFTGQVGKLFDNKKEFIVDLLLMLLGNFIGAMGLGLLASFIIPNETYHNLIISIGKTKLLNLTEGGISWYQLLIQSIFCGMLVYFAVEIYKAGKDIVTKVLGLLMAVAAFVISGYSHCIANMYYLGVSRLFITEFGNSMLSLLIAIVGNSFGSIIINFLFKIGFKEKKDN